MNTFDYSQIIKKKKAFNGSSIESISIPSDISELQDGCRCGTSKFQMHLINDFVNAYFSMEHQNLQNH